MKAILVIDIPDGFERLQADVDVNTWTKGLPYERTRVVYLMNCPLRPLPNRMSEVTPATDFTHPLTIHSQGIHDGWNMCLDEIIGENDESNINS